MQARLVRLSKVMAHALRHKPEQYGLTLDNEGWVPLTDLLASLRQRNQWRDASERDIEHVLEQSDKQRFEVRNGRIRAFYGHSVATKMEKESAIPPAILYHGTTPQASEAIMREGLKPMNRQYVHLSADRETALSVARRRTQHPVIFGVDTQKAAQEGVKFYLGNDMVWLADPVPSTSLSREE